MKKDSLREPGASRNGCLWPRLSAKVRLLGSPFHSEAGLRITASEGQKNITLFIPAKMIAEDAGEAIVTKFLEIAGGMGFGYKNNTGFNEKQVS